MKKEEEEEEEEEEGRKKKEFELETWTPFAHTKDPLSNELDDVDVAVLLHVLQHAILQMEGVLSDGLEDARARLVAQVLHKRHVCLQERPAHTALAQQHLVVHVLCVCTRKRPQHLTSTEREEGGKGGRGRVGVYVCVSALLSLCVLTSLSTS